MKIKKLPLVIYLLLSMLVLPGWRIHPTNSEIYQHTATQKPSVRFAAILDKNGKLVCQVDLVKHSELVPNFADLNTTNLVDQTNQLQKESTLSAEEMDPLPCTSKYLNQLKETATNNIIINGDQSHIHKASWMKYAGGAVVCALGIVSYLE